MVKSRKAYKPLMLMCYRWDVDHAHHSDLKEMKSMLLEGQRKGKCDQDRMAALMIDNQHLNERHDKRIEP
eukprot:908890-Rhodomonas_salina.1